MTLLLLGLDPIQSVLTEAWLDATALENLRTLHSLSSSLDNEYIPSRDILKVLDSSEFPNSEKAREHSAYKRNGKSRQRLESENAIW